MEIQRLEKMSKQVRLKPDYVWKNLHRLLCSEELWILAYEKQKSNVGTPTSAMTLDDPVQGMSLERIRNTILLFKKGAWKPQIDKKVQILKPRTKEIRIIEMQDEMDKLAQGVVLLILQALYEPIFRKYNYGIRPGMGTHEALQYIERNFQSIDTVLESDIKTCYPVMHHSILIQILKRRISDKKFLDVIQKMLKAGLWGIKTDKLLTLDGTLPGSIVSPMIANIYLHEMDLFIESWYKKNIIPLIKKRKKDLLFSTSINVKSKVKNLQKSHNFNVKENRALKLKILDMLAVTPKNITPRLIYVRYADNFILGTSLDTHNVVKLEDDLTKFLKNKLALTLNEKKSKIVNISKESCFFLGYNIKIDTSKKLLLIKPNNKSPYLKKITGHFVKLEIPIQNIINKLSQKSLCTRTGKPLSMGRLTPYDDQDIVRYGSALLRSLLNFYAPSVSTAHKHRIRYIVKFSLLHTFAHKYKSTVKRMHLKFGPDITVEYESTDKKDIVTSKYVKLDKVNPAIMWKIGSQFKNIESGYLGKSEE